MGFCVREFVIHFRFLPDLTYITLNAQCVHPKFVKKTQAVTREELETTTSSFLVRTRKVSQEQRRKNNNYFTTKMAIRQLTLSSTCRLSYVQKNTRKSQSQFFKNSLCLFQILNGTQSEGHLAVLVQEI